jgi:drug/metabolite transporter (DMT)-like permease
LSPWAVHLVLLAAQLCFASLPVFGKMALRDIPPPVIVLVRMTGGAIVFALLAWRRGGLRVDRRDVPLLALCALLGVAANQELYINGLARSTATNASVLGATIPVFTALVAIIMRREPPRARRLAGIGVAFAGAAALVGIDQLSTSSEHAVGSAMVLVNSASYGTYLVVVRPLADRYDPVALLAILFAFALPMVAPFGIAAWSDMPPVDARVVGYLVYLVVIPTVGAYSLVQIALRHAEASLVAAYIYLQPVLATCGAIALLDEAPTVRLVACGAVVLAGVWLATTSARMARR